MALQDEIRRVINERLLPLNWTIQDLIDNQNLLRRANGEPYTLNTIQTLPYNRSDSLPDLDLGIGNHVNNGQSVLFYRVDITADGQLIFALPEHVNQEEHLTHLGNLTNMLLIKKIEEWKKYPNALGSESQVAVLLGELSSFLNEPIPDTVLSALKILSLRGTMRDIASAIQRERFNPDIPSFHDVVDTAAISCGLSWTEALTIIVTYLEEKKRDLS